jgi:hypothetical protein
VKNNKPPSKEICLRMAQTLFDDPFFHRSNELGWQYLFIWAMYDHWIEEYWTK